MDYVGDYLWVGIVDVGEHEEVGVAGFGAYGVRPVLVVAEDAVDAGFVRARVVVCSREVGPGVLLGGVGWVAAGEVEGQPGGDLVGEAISLLRSVRGEIESEGGFRSGWVVEEGGNLPS